MGARFGLNDVSQPAVWQDLKRTMVDSLNKKKVPHTLEILENTYSNSDTRPSFDPPPTRSKNAPAPVPVPARPSSPSASLREIAPWK